MKRVFSPNKSSLPISYSSATIESLERPDVAEDSTSLISGSVFGDGKFAWLARGSSLEVVNTSDGCRRGAWRFGWQANHRRAMVVISCVTECSMEDGVKLMVGLKDLSGSSSSPGMVCLFDPWVSRLTRAVVIPYPVTTVECVRTEGGAHVQPTLLSFHLKLFFGIITVGTEQGHTYLVDMRSDDADDEFDEISPSHLELINPGTQNIAHARQQARNNGTHLAIELGGQFHGSGKFSYVYGDSRDVKVSPAGETFVTSIKYIKEATCLAVGYNFGCFHIWNLESMSLAYSSQVDQYVSAVTHFAYQEPENDPRNCSYLWVARGPLSSDEQAETPATLTLYQLVFGSRQPLPGFGTVFRDLGGCGRRFEHQLTADAHHLADATSVGSRVICCYTLGREHVTSDLSKSLDNRDEEGTKMRDLTLMVCVWESPSHDQLAQPTCHLGVFDINRWYHSQMLPSIRDAMFGSKHPTCSFFAFFSLAKVLDTASPDGIVDVHVGSGSVSRFFSGCDPAQEQHFWPAALRFDTCSLMETGIVKSTFLGIQRQILANLIKQGSSGQLPDPHEHFNMCWMAGLLPRNFDISKPQDKSFHYEALLSVALEHNLVAFITSCVQKLGAGNVTHTGCSLRLILDWAWSNVVSSKEQLDLLCVPLFDGGGGTPDEQMLGILDHMMVKLQNLTVIFQALIDQTAPTTQQGVKDLEAKHNVVSILAQYLQVLMWLIRHGLLPEYTEGNSSALQRGKCYPGVSLGKVYEARRAELQACIGDTASSGLMIDKMVSEIAHKWTSPDSTNQYPPASLHGLCSLYLLQDVPLESKHAIVFYLLLDMCGFDAVIANKQVANRFAKAFNMTPGLTEMIRAFWFLDHKEFEQAVSCLVSPGVDMELGPWQNSHIIRTLLFQGQPKTALYFIKTLQPTLHTAVDLKLHLSIQIVNGLVTEAFAFQRDHRDPSSDMELLHHFFLGCQQTGNMCKVMQLPFNAVEEECFVKFLMQDIFPSSRELLVMYYLQRGHYVEGVRLNEALKQELQDDVEDPVLLERAKVRNAIVDGYIKCLPSIQRKLILESDKPAVQPTACREVPRPRPLSTVVHPANKNRPVTHATILTSVMEKVAESRVPDATQDKKASPFVSTPLTPKLKSILSDSNHVVLAAVKRPELPDTLYIERKSPKTPFGSPSFLDRKRNRHLYSGAEALRLLSTPTFVKRSSSRTEAVTEPITVATPQSILKVTRVLRRTSPRPSPSASPPMTRHSSFEQLMQAKPDSAVKDVEKDVEDNVATPSRRIRFAVEDSPSPTSVSPVSLHAPSPDPAAPTDHDMPSKESSMASDTGGDFTDATESTPRHEDSRGEDTSLKLELSHTTEDEEEEEAHITAAVVDLSHSHDSDMEDEVARDEDTEVHITAAVVDLSRDSDMEDDEVAPDEETEVHITAAVVDLSHSRDSDMEDDEVAPDEDDYSSYELDDSDADDESEDDSEAQDGGLQRGTESTGSRDGGHSDERRSSPHRHSPKAETEQRTPPPAESPVLQPPPPQHLMTPVVAIKPLASPSKITSRAVASPPKAVISEASSSESPARGSPGKAASRAVAKASPVISEASSSESPARGSPAKSRPPRASSPPRTSPVTRSHVTGLLSQPALTMTPPKSPELTARLEVPQRPSNQPQQDSYVFAPPMVLRATPTRQGFLETLAEDSPARTSEGSSFLFSPPLTRSAMKRRSLDVTRSLRPRDPAGRATPHQSPSDSPISFVTPGPAQSPRSRRRSDPKRKTITRKALHQMTLRSRSGPQRLTRSARLPPAPE